ncbi:MAG TPA: DUF1684 domain-containing protein [Terracidiphilus sp.]
MMRVHKAWLALAFLGAAVSSTAAQTAVAPPLDGASGSAGWRQQVDAWRSQREHELAAPDSWLTLIGLEWLKPGINSFGAASDNLVKIHAQAPDHIGLLTVSGSTVQLLAPNGGFPADLKLDNAPAREGTLSADDTRPSTLTWHGLTMVVLPRGGRYALRIKDAASPTRTAFHGLHWYEPDARFRVTAKWIPFAPPRVEKIPTIIGTTLDMPAPGIAEFVLNGKTIRLEPVLEGGEKDKLFFILRDETSKTTTYQAARFLHTGLPDHGLAQPGALTLDFNELYNPPCAYTPYATCPLPPDQNRLAVAIEAGEQRYSH